MRKIVFPLVALTLALSSIAQARPLVSDRGVQVELRGQQAYFLWSQIDRDFEIGNFRGFQFEADGGNERFAIRCVRAPGGDRCEIQFSRGDFEREDYLPMLDSAVRVIDLSSEMAEQIHRALDMPEQASRRGGYVFREKGFLLPDVELGVRSRVTFPRGEDQVFFGSVRFLYN